MQLGNSREQTDTEILMDTQTEIKVLIKEALVSVVKTIRFYDDLQKLVDKNLAEMKNEQLKNESRPILIKFGKDLFIKLANDLNMSKLVMLVGFYQYSDVADKEKPILQKEINKHYTELGVGGVNKVYMNLGNSQAKVSRGQSLYGHSEMVARFEETQKMLEDAKKSKLVICDTHSDCSDRCFKWQGRIYSTDGTSGTTEDGKHYIPIEVAINDTTYGQHNGLFGYNCRHKVVPYHKGMKAVKVGKEEQKREKAISNYQRQLEREIRNAKDSAIAFKNVELDKYLPKELQVAKRQKYLEYKAKADKLTREYVEFCHKYNRVEYRSRLQV